MRILLVEDDADLLLALAFHLKHEGYAVDSCESGGEALLFFRQGAYDLAILDRMLPEMDGVEILQTIRSEGNPTPVLMLTALSAVGDRVSGLDAGADDYMVKPFDTQELLARVRAMARRPVQWAGGGVATSFGDITLHESDLRLCSEGGEVILSKKEASLLREMMRAGSETLPREVLFQRIWGAAEVEDANLDSYIHFARKHLAQIGARAKIITVRGVGFRLEMP